MIKYTLSQYVHDGFRLELIGMEKAKLRSYTGSYEFVALRMRELTEEELDVQKRMYKFERLPNNR